MATLSLAMIVKNEEATLARVLGDAAGFCDELVVVDTGSTDRTVEIAQATGARVEHFTWVDDFAAARNASFQACRSDWIIWLDADDRVVPEVQRELASLKERLDDSLDAVYLPYRYHFDETGDVCTWTFPRERLLRRATGPTWEGAVHEVISVADPARALWLDSVWVEHRPLPEARAIKGDRNLRILERVVREGDRSPRALFYYANELADNNRDADALVVWSEFVDAAPPGWERYEALTAMAKAQDRLGHSDHAIATLHRAMREDPTRAEAYVLMGLVYYRLERWTAAAPYFLAATACRPPQSGFVSARDYAYLPWDYLSVCYQRMGDQPRALDALAKAIESNPDRDRLIDNAGWILRNW